MVPLNLTEWLMVVGIALGLLLTVEVAKWINNRVHPQRDMATGTRHTDLRSAHI